MPLTRDVINIPVNSLSPLSRKVFDTEVLRYQLQLLFMRGPESYDELQKMVTVRFKDGVVIIEGPQYDDAGELDTDGPFTDNWKVIFNEYLLKPGFIDALVQLRFISINPLTIYYQLLAIESRIFGKEQKGGNLSRMKRAVIEFPDIEQSLEIKDYPLIDDKKLKKREDAEDKVYYNYTRTTFGDGHVNVERDEKDIAGRGKTLGLYAEGFVDESIPRDIPVGDLRDHPEGMLINLFPGYPFFAFNYRNIYPKIHDLNRLIESGMQVVFVDKLEGMEDKPLKVIETEYRRFFRDWGIPVIDYVTSERISLAEMKPLVNPPEGSVSGIKYINIPNFFVIQRPIEKLHSAAWCGMNTDRRRGVTGIPWAKDEYSGMDIASPQPDDGFLSYFVKEGIKRRMMEKLSVQIFFPLCAIHTHSEIRKLFKKVEVVLKRSIKHVFYPEEGVVGVFLRSMGEWIILRAVLRKYL